MQQFIPIILTVHVLIVIALIGVVLLQRSEGGALGIGGGGGGGLMSGRGAANVLTRSTSILAALFFATSLGLAMTSGNGETETNIFNETVGADPDASLDGGIDAEGLAAPFETAPANPLDTIGAPDAPAAPETDPAKSQAPAPEDQGEDQGEEEGDPQR